MYMCILCKSFIYIEDCGAIYYIDFVEVFAISDKQNAHKSSHNSSLYTSQKL